LYSTSVKKQTHCNKTISHPPSKGVNKRDRQTHREGGVELFKKLKEGECLATSILNGTKGKGRKCANEWGGRGGPTRVWRVTKKKVKRGREGGKGELVETVKGRRGKKETLSLKRTLVKGGGKGGN